jgi:death-on-curing protein
VSAWIWLSREVIVAVHEMQLAEHGGLAGVRDAGLMDSALSRAPNLAAYGQPDAAALAAAYGWGLSRNHPFMDGNKRTGFVAAELFLNLNGYELQATDAECVLTMLGVAAGDVSEDTFATWLRSHIVARA